MILQGIRLVTFDATNTLLKFRVSPWVYYAQVARGYGFKGTEEQLHKRFYENYKLVWNYYPNFGSETIGWKAWWKHVIKRTFREHYELSSSLDKLSEELIEDFKTSKCWTQANAAPDLIKNLRDRNISVGIISNFDPRLHTILGEVGFDSKCFEFVLTSYAAKCMKPNPDIFDMALKACSRLDINEDLRTEDITAAEALHIGDDYENDYCGARFAGWKSTLILNDKSLDHSVPDGDVFKSLAHLNDFLLNKDMEAIPVLDNITSTLTDEKNHIDLDKIKVEQQNSKPSSESESPVILDTGPKMCQNHTVVPNQVPDYTAKTQLENTPNVAKTCILANQDNVNTMKMGTYGASAGFPTNYTGVQYKIVSWQDAINANKPQQEMTPNYTTVQQPMYGYDNSINNPGETHEAMQESYPGADTQSQEAPSYSNQWYPNSGYANQQYNYYQEYNNQAYSNQNYLNQNINKEYTYTGNNSSSDTNK